MLLKISEMCGLLFFFFLSKFTFITNIDVPTYFASMLQVCIFFFVSVTLALVRTVKKYT